MKSCIKLSAISLAILFSLNSYAATKKTSDADRYKMCKQEVRAQLDDVQSIKLAKLSNYKKVFTAKLRVQSANQRSTVLCTINQDGAIALQTSLLNAYSKNSPERKQP